MIDFLAVWSFGVLCGVLLGSYLMVYLILWQVKKALPSFDSSMLMPDFPSPAELSLGSEDDTDE